MHIINKQNIDYLKKKMADKRKWNHYKYHFNKYESLFVIRINI